MGYFHAQCADSGQYIQYISKKNWGNAIPISTYDTSTTATTKTDEKDENDNALMTTIEQIETIKQNYEKQTHFLAILPSLVIDIIHSYSPLRTVRYNRRLT
jgi:hypothetical protein